MTNSKFTEVMGIAMAIIIFFLLIKNEKKSLQIKVLKKEIDDNENINEEIKKKLKDLIQNNSDVDTNVANELSQIVALIEIKQDTSAILKLAKIIKNLLKELYKGDPKVKELANKNGRKMPAFADYIEHSKSEKLISPEDYHLLSILKIIRNEEAHDLDIKKEKSSVLAALISGIGLILVLCKTLKKKTLAQTE